MFSRVTASEMEGFVELICQSCNMAFHSAGLLDKHKAKFCIGTDLKDSVALWRGRKAKKAAVKIVHPAKEQRTKEGQRKSSPGKVSENTTGNKLTQEVSEEKQTGEELRTLDLFQNHEQRLAEIRERHHQLEKERDVIEQRLAELAGRQRTVHLEDLRCQEQRNGVVLHQLSSHITSMKELVPSEVSFNPLEERKAHVTFDLISSVDGPLSAQIRALRLAYMQSGGSDPEVLAHMHDLQAEALTLEQPRPRVDGRTKGRRMKALLRVLDCDVLAVEQENQKLEEEIFRMQLARERHRGLIGIQKDHIYQTANLQSEIFQRREKEKRQGSSLAQAHSDLPLDQSSNQYSMGSHINDPMETPYDPVSGFVIFYDVVIGLEATVRWVRLLAGLYCNGQQLGQTTPMPPVQCQPAGTALHSKSPGNYAILGVKQHVPRKFGLYLILEIQASRGLELNNEPDGSVSSHGWTKIDLFDQDNQVHRGHWRLPFHSLPVQASLNQEQLNSMPQLGNMEICLRVAKASEEAQALTNMDCNNINQYKNPSLVPSDGGIAEEQDHTSKPLPSSPERPYGCFRAEERNNSA